MILNLKDKLNLTLKDITFLKSIAGRSMSQCKKAIESSNNIQECFIFLIKLGVPAVQLNEKYKAKFKLDYPNYKTMIKNLKITEY